MEIILLKDIDALGYKHDIVTVKNGYGRNFLIPKGLAVMANDSNRVKLQEILAKEEKEEAARLGEYKELLEKVEGQVLKIGVKAGTTGKIFGRVTNIQIVNALKEQLGLDVPRKKVVVSEDIKEVGQYEAKLDLHEEVQGSVGFELIQE
jgi:large subunit ribosomal protein L9